MTALSQHFSPITQRVLPIECNGTFPWSANILDLGSPDFHLNVQSLAHDIVCRRHTAKAVRICAAILVGCVVKDRACFLHSLVRNIERSADTVIKSLAADAPTLIRDVSQLSPEAAQMLISGLEAYSELADDQRLRLIDDLKGDAERYYLAHDLAGEEISKAYPAFARRSVAFLMILVGALLGVFVRHGWAANVLIIPFALIVWFAPLGKAVFLAKPAEDVRNTLRRRASLKLRALGDMCVLINEVHYGPLHQPSVPSWMSQPELEIDYSDMEYVRVLGRVKGKYQAEIADYEFTITMHLYEEDSLELHRQRFRDELYEHLRKAREQLARTLRIID